MNEKDLRVVKTRNAIESVFLDMLNEKPLEKITVTELAKRAQINKGTFYLHYQDIYDLHEKLLCSLFEDMIQSAEYFSLFTKQPEVFIEKFRQTIAVNYDFFQLLMQKRSPDTVQEKLVDILCAKIYDIGGLQKSIENDIRLESILNSLLFLMPKYKNNQDEIASMVRDMVQLFWRREV